MAKRTSAFGQNQRLNVFVSTTRTVLSFFLFLACSVVAEAADSTYSAIWKKQQGAIATVNPLATQAGLNAFDQGGNAIDAALAAAFTLGVVDSHNSGIGGGLFILIRYPDGRIQAIDGREMAPAAATGDMFHIKGKYHPELSRTGALAIGVPGSVAALYELQKDAGKLTFSDVLLPAAEIAENGFKIDNVMAKRLLRNHTSLQKFPDTAAIFLNTDGSSLQTGDVLKQKDLAKTYRKLAKHGPEYFYKGGFAKKVEKWMKSNSGIVTRRDFANYHIKYRKPVETTFNGYDIYGFPPPSSGGVHVAQILNIVESFLSEGVDLTKFSDADRYHLLIEAMKLAFADRAYWLGDADFVDVPKGLIDKAYAKRLAKKIDLKKATTVDGHETPPNAAKVLFDKHTTHISVADANGYWVAITTTLNTSFGSKVTIPGTGVLMNNQMDDFAAHPGEANAFGLVGYEANAVAAGKRPLSSMSPTIVLKNGKPVLTVGAAGGPTIITQVLQTLVNYLALGDDLPSAVSRVRVHNQWRPERVFIDAHADPELWKELERRGHTLKKWPPFGATQAISFDNGSFSAVTEPRLVSGNR